MISSIDDWSIDDQGLLTIFATGDYEGEPAAYKGRILLDSIKDWPESDAEQLTAAQSWPGINWELDGEDAG